MSLLPLATFSAPGVPLYGGGGGGGGGSSFSTLSASTIVTSTLTVTNGAVIENGLSMSNLPINFGVPSATPQSVMYYNATSSNTYITGVSTASVNIGTQLSPTTLQVTDGSVIINNALTVSSINGTQPIGKVAYPVSTLTGGQTYIPQGNVAWPLSGAIPVTAGHTYRISGALGGSNAGGTGHTSLTISGGGAGFPNFLVSYPNSLLNPGNAGLSGGVSAVCQPSASPLQIVAYNTDGTTSTGMEFYSLNWIVEDLGTL